jgi:peptide/nickel transport system permease protein
MTNSAANLSIDPGEPAGARAIAARACASLVWRRFRRSIRGVVGAACVILLVLIAVLAPVLANNQPIACRYNGELHFPALVQVLHAIPGVDRLLPMPKPFRLPTFDAKGELRLGENTDWVLWPPIRFAPQEIDKQSDVLARPSAVHWLGTDEVGRDVASRMIHGTRVAVLVGFVSMGIAALIGITLGALAGYYRGWVDLVISRLIEVVICFPVFFLILSIMVWLEPSIYNVMICIGLVRWTTIARYTRAEFIRQGNAEYVAAAKALGLRPRRIMLRHMLPNSLAPILPTITFGIAGAILIEGGLSWLGFGVPMPQASWGSILRAGYQHLGAGPHLIYPPCVAIFVGVLVFNLVGDALRDAIDPRLHGYA